jgi:hypothetical protein
MANGEEKGRLRQAIVVHTSFWHSRLHQRPNTHHQHARSPKKYDMVVASDRLK